MENGVSIDLGAFVTLVSPTRLAIMGMAFALCIILGAAGALKAKQFKWVLILKWVAPELNFFWMIIAYIVAAFMAAVMVPSWGPEVATLSAFIMGTMVLQLKEQLAFLAPNLPVINWKLPLEQPSKTVTPAKT
jgi:hypothetical protein